MDHFPSSVPQIMSEQERDNQDQLDRTIIRELHTHTFQGEWEEVENLYKTKPGVRNAEIMSSEDTALHVAIDENEEDVVGKLVDIIYDLRQFYWEKAKEALKKKNGVGDTPLHRAAANGSVKMCKRIVEAAKNMGENLLGNTNKWDENPIFVAVFDNRKQAFIYFHGAFDKEEDNELLISAKGDTVLHAAIQREHYDLAFHILQRCPHLVGRYNEKGMTPLHILASKPSAFRSSYHLSWWRSIIYHCIRVDPLELCDTSDPERSSELECPDNKRTCYQCYEFLSSLCFGRSVMAKRDPENHYVRGNVPENCVTWFQFLFMVLRHLFGVLGCGNKFREIIKARQKHTWSVQILDELTKDLGQLPDYFGDKKKDDKAPKRIDTALLVAVRYGVLEVVTKILERLPVSIHDVSLKKKNIVLVAVENRHARIFKALQKHLNEVVKKPQLWEAHVRAVDDSDNTILHLAAKCGESKSHLWQIHGSAMQMQWEIKWYELVQSFVPPHFVFLANKEGKTPALIFTDEHKELVKDSSEWLKDTSESCSVVAALVAGVSFATSSQVPGGIDDKTGRPKLEGHPAFDLFAVTALIALCFSVTALIMFLAILTSRKQPKDFKSNLPNRLLLGLSSLFVSIASMLISFCAAHYFVLEERFKRGVFPLYAATCLPVSFYAIAQFPLYTALLKAFVWRIPRSNHFGHL